jgi:ABC-type multidrug transport system permease subunit
MGRDVENFFMCFLAICTSSFVKALLSTFAYFFTGSLIVLGTFAFSVVDIFNGVR